MGRSVSFKESATDEALQTQTAAQAGGSGSLLRSGRGLRLGLGAVTRNASGSAKGKGPGQVQKPVVFSQPVQPVSAATNQKSQDDSGKKKIKKKIIWYKWAVVHFIPGYQKETASLSLQYVWFHFSNLKFDTPESYLISLSSEMGLPPSSFKLAWDEGSSLKCLSWD